MSHLFDEVIEPILKFSFNGVQFIYDKEKGKILAKKISQAREDDNHDDYNSSIDDIFN